MCLCVQPLEKKYISVFQTYWAVKHTYLTDRTVGIPISGHMPKPKSSAPDLPAQKCHY